jgi:phospholipid/cholesterol/gamma-HCH transport system substrate-binding protein
MRARDMRARAGRLKVYVAAAAVLSTLALSGCEAYDLPLPGSPVDADHAIEVTAEFRDVLSLVPRSPVQVNDVTVGEVVDVTRDGWHAEVRMRVQDDVKLPSNVVAGIRQTSLLGEKYVILEPAPGEPAHGRLSDGDHIPLEHTGRNPELEEVLGSLAFLLNGGGLGQIKTITTEVNKIFDGRQDRVRHVLGELETLVRGLDQQKGDIIHAMESMNSLASTLNREKDTVTAAIDSFGPAVKVLADQHQQLMTMLKALDRLGVVGTRVIGATKDDLLASLRHLQPVLRQIANVDDQLPQALGLLISFPFPIESNDIVHGDYANTSIVFSMDLDNLYKNNAGGGGPTLPDLSDICKKLPLDLSGSPVNCDDLGNLPGTGGGLPGLGGGLKPPKLGNKGHKGKTKDGGSAGNLGDLLGGGLP